MKRPINKADIRCEIEQQIDEFLNRGGAVEQIERGISGRYNNDPIRPSRESFQNAPKTERTYVPEVIAALEARRQQKPEKPKPVKKRKPRKKIIYDDFGEPLRWEWVED